MWRNLVSQTPQTALDCSAPPAQAFPEWPPGWYSIGESHQITRKPIGLDLFGRPLVHFRSVDGRAVVMDAKCWHMGADLSEGQLVRDQIVCGFHGWQYTSSGNCVHIPGQNEIPACARQRTYCTAEYAGRVFVFPESQSEYPLPFFSDVNPRELVAAPSFEFVIDCPWWLVGSNGFDLQHFAGPHHRRLLGPPMIESEHPAARRLRATFEVCGENCRDRLTRRFAGRYVTMDVTVWSGILAFVIARFHRKLNCTSDPPSAISYGMTEVRPTSSSPEKQSLVRVTIFSARHSSLGLLDQLAARTKRNFIRAFLKPDTLLLNGAQYNPTHLIDADRPMVDYLRWLAIATNSRSISEEPTWSRELGRSSLP
jgi:nitrite reductase/ring-hydroxylating ferredoxin subunit